MATKKVVFNYGIMAEPLEVQAHDAGFILRQTDKFQKVLHAIHMCNFHVASEAEVKIMMRRLSKKLGENLHEIKD